MGKILLISPKDNNFYNFRSELILTLKDMGNDIVLVCPYGEKIDFFTERGCRFIDMEVDRRGTNILSDFKLVLAYKKILRMEKPDVVLTYTTKCSVYGGIVCRFLKIPYIVNNAGLIDTDNKILNVLLPMLYKLGFGGASCMMYQNHEERDSINKLLKGRVHYRDIPGSGVNLEQFEYKKYPASDDIIIFNFVARIVSIKGIKEFLDCAEIIKAEYENTRFVIYGDYDENEYAERIQNLSDSGIVEYGGIKLDMRPYIEEAHAVIHPSYYEGMTNVVLEHSAMGRVCIGSNISGVKEAIQDGDTGFLFRVKDVQSLTEAVRRFLELSHEEKEIMGKNARKKMEREFKREIVTNIYLEEINRIRG